MRSSVIVVPGSKGADPTSKKLEHSGVPTMFASRDLTEETEMSNFLGACIAAILIAALGATVLSFYQEPVHVAYATESARI